MKNTFFYDFVKKTKPQQLLVRVCKNLFLLKLEFQSYFQFKFVIDSFVSNAFEE